MRSFLSLSLLCLLALSSWAQTEPLAPGADVVGFGYDVFGEYANQKSKKPRQLFEFGQMQKQPIGGQIYQVPNGILFEHIADHKIKKASGSSIRDYSKSLAVSAGLQGETMFFSASIETQYGKTENTTEQTYYSTYLDINTKWRVSLEAVTDAEMRAALKPAVLNHINTMDAQTLFDTYGSHFIYSAYLGGRADFSTTTTSKRRVSEEELHVAVEAKYKAVSGQSSMDLGSKKVASDIKVDSKTRVLGGNSHTTNDIGNPVQYQEWAKGIVDMPVLCDFDNNSLRPIWILADNPARRTTLEAAFKKRCERFPLPKAMANMVDLTSSLFHVRPKTGNKYFDLPGSADQIGTQVKLWDLDKGLDRFISFVSYEKEPEWMIMQAQNTNLVFQLTQGGETQASQLQLAARTNADEQLFKLEPVEGEPDTYLIRAKKGNTLLTCTKQGAQTNGTNLLFSPQNAETTLLQQWVLERTKPEDLQPNHKMLYRIRNLGSNKYWDMPGFGLTAQMKGGTLTIWDADNSPDRDIKLNPVTQQPGWFTLQPHHSPYMLAVEGARNDNKSPLILWDNNGSTNTQFTFEYAGAPNTYYIRVKHSNKYLQVEGDQINTNGARVIQSQFSGNESQKWVLENTNRTDNHHVIGQKFYIKVKASNKYWDIPGTGAETNKKDAKIKIWDLDNGADRIVILRPCGEHEFWRIEFQNGGLCADIEGPWKLTDMSIPEQALYRAGKSDKKLKGDKGADLQLWNCGNSDNQKFRIEHTSDTGIAFINKHSGKALDVSGAKVHDNGSQIQQWDRNNGPAQEFQLIYADGPNKGKPYRP